MRKKIYVAASLTQAPKQFKQHVANIKTRLSKNYKVLEWLGLIKGTARDVYFHDIKMVKSCDLLLAEVSYPAIGLGFEIAYALQQNKQVLAIAKENAKVSRLILGIKHKKYNFSRYTTIEDIFSLIMRI